MKGTWRLGQFFGIEVRVHVTFAIFFVAIGMWGILQGEAVPMGQMMTFMGGVFLLAILHEGAHALAARRFGIQTKEMILMPFAGVSKLDRRVEDPMQQFVIAIAGPVANFALAATLFIILLLQGVDPVLLVETVVRGSAYLLSLGGEANDRPLGASTEILELSLLLGIINLFPSWPLDGGPALRAFLTGLTDRARAIKYTARVAAILSLTLVAVGLLVNPLLAVLGFFVYMSSRQESTMVAARLMLEGLQVRAAMTTKYFTLTTWETLEQAATLLVRSTQQDFPVLGDDGRFLAMLSRNDLLRELRGRGAMARVMDASRRGMQTLSPDEKLEDLFDQWSGLPPVSFPVLEDGQLVGMLNADGIQKLLMIRDIATSKSAREA